VSGHIFDISFHLPPQRLVTEKSRAAATSLANAARHRRTPYPAAAADAFADDNGETVVAMHEGQRAIFYLILHMRLRPLIFRWLQIFRRSCQAGQMF
jgi:hypothetical protein